MKLSKANKFRPKVKFISRNPSQIRTACLQTADLAAKARLPDHDATRKMIQRTRNEEIGAPVNPNTLADLVIPPAFQNYLPGELFLLNDSGQNAGPNRILLFGRASYQNWSHAMSTVFMDGTFSLAPPLFSQANA